MGVSKLSIGVVLLGILYSTAYCDTSDIFNILKPNHSSSSSSSHQHQHKKTHEHTSKINNGASVQSDSKAKAKTVPKVTPTNPIIQSNATGNGTFEGRQGWGMTGGSGWGWPAMSGSNMDLYSLLAALAFLGLLGSLFMIFPSRTSTASTPTIIVTGKRRKRDLQSGGEEDVLAETFADIMSRISLSIERPWWNEQSDSDKKTSTSFKLL